MLLLTVRKTKIKKKRTWKAHLKILCKLIFSDFVPFKPKIGSSNPRPNPLKIVSLNYMLR